MNLKKISKIINLYDKPNQKRKIHLVSTPSIGGIIFLFNLTNGTACIELNKI